MSLSLPGSLVSTEWLVAHLGDADLVILDGSFKLHLAGKDDVAIYDGAWTEWGRPGDTPVDTGAGKGAQGQ